MRWVWAPVATAAGALFAVLLIGAVRPAGKTPCTAPTPVVTVTVSNGVTLAPLPAASLPSCAPTPGGR